MLAKKTIRIAEFRDRINAEISSETQARYLSDRGVNVDDWRKGLCSALEQALHAANAYAGFRYVDGWPQANDNGTEHKRHYN